MSKDKAEPNIEVVLTGPENIYCFKLVFQVCVSSDSEERVPLEIHLHTNQAIGLFSKLGVQLSEYFRRASAELLEISSRQLPTKAGKRGSRIGSRLEEL